MKRAALALLLLATTAATAQEPGADIPDVPPGDGVIRGRVLHAETLAPAPGVPVVLYALGGAGEAGLRRVDSDAQGAFAFAGISSGVDVTYLVGARFEDVPFAERTSFLPGENEKTLEILVRGASRDGSAAQIASVRLKLERGCEDVRVDESVELRNATERVIMVPPEARDGATPLYRASLPAGARSFQAPIGNLDQGLSHDGDTISFWGPLYPGSQEVRYAYSLTASDADGSVSVRRRFESAAARVDVYTPEGAPRPVGEGLRAGPIVDLERERWASAFVENVADGGELVFSWSAGSGRDSERISLARARMWLEIDDAALSVDENHELVVAGDGPLVAESGGPVLCLDLPPGASDLRFSPETLELGLSPDPSGALAVRGPLPAGESSLTLRYRLPVVEEPFELTRRFVRELPLLQIFIADTGLLVETDTLHRRRPVRSADRFFMQYEGFEIGAEEPISLALHRLPPAGPGSRSAAVGFLLLAAVGAIAFLAAPLRGRRDEAGVAETAEAQEREALYAAIRDLDEDFETGKLSPEDHAAMRRDLRARAAALLELEREGQRETPSPAERSAKRGDCRGCGAPLPDDARFCPQCGASLEAADG